MNLPALIMFLAFVATTLVVTSWAARRSGSRAQFYTAGGNITGFQNAFAFAGDLLSASVFLGGIGIYFTSGYDALVYSIGALTSFPLLTFLLSDRLRDLGRFTFADVLTWRLESPAVRLVAVAATIVISLFYMVGQLVGAGVLMRALLGLDFTVCVSIIGGLMIVYVAFGGMVAATWVQIVKAAILLATGLALATWVLSIFHWDFEALLAQAVARHPNGDRILGPTSLVSSPVAGLSLALTLALGPLGLPHLLMRFFTVPDVKEARRSAAWGTVLIGSFYLLMIPVGYGAVALLAGDPRYASATGALKGGSNMASLDLAHALGGNLFFGFCAAVAFATILAVVAGLTMAAAATISHDLFATVLRKGRQSEAEELTISRIAALVFGIFGILLSIVFQDQNVTFLVVMGVAIAASTTFPLLMLALFWPPLSVGGVVAGGLTGLVSATAGIILGPSVWVTIFHNPEPIFPYQYPTVVSLPLALAVAMGVSVLERRRPLA